MATGCGGQFEFQQCVNQYHATHHCRLSGKQIKNKCKFFSKSFKNIYRSVWPKVKEMVALVTICFSILGKSENFAVIKCSVKKLQVKIRGQAIIVLDHARSNHGLLANEASRKKINIPGLRSHWDKKTTVTVIVLIYLHDHTCSVQHNIWTSCTIYEHVNKIYCH